MPSNLSRKIAEAVCTILVEQPDLNYLADLIERAGVAELETKLRVAIAERDSSRKAYAERLTERDALAQRLEVVVAELQNVRASWPYDEILARVLCFARGETVKRT